MTSAQLRWKRHYVWAHSHRKKQSMYKVWFYLGLLASTGDLQHIPSRKGRTSVLCKNPSQALVLRPPSASLQNLPKSPCWMDQSSLSAVWLVSFSSRHSLPSMLIITPRRQGQVLPPFDTLPPSSLAPNSVQIYFLITCPCHIPASVSLSSLPHDRCLEKLLLLWGEIGGLTLPPDVLARRQLHLLLPQNRNWRVGHLLWKRPCHKAP